MAVTSRRAREKARARDAVLAASQVLLQKSYQTTTIDDSDDERDCPGVAAHRGRVAMILDYLANATKRGQQDGSVLCMHEASTLACQPWSGMMGALLFSSRCADLADVMPFDFESASFTSGVVDLLCAGVGVTT